MYLNNKKVVILRRLTLIFTIFSVVLFNATLVPTNVYSQSHDYEFTENDEVLIDDYLSIEPTTNNLYLLEDFNSEVPTLTSISFQASALNTNNILVINDDKIPLLDMAEESATVTSEAIQPNEPYFIEKPIIDDEEEVMERIEAKMRGYELEDVKDHNMYTNEFVNVRTYPSADSDDTIIKVLGINEKVKVLKEVKDDNWYEIELDGQECFICKDYLSKKKKKIENPKDKPVVYTWNGEVLNRYNGVVSGPSGKETYYNLDMSGVVRIMRNMGNNDEYWIRSDGAKMLGNYVMCAADLSVRPRGSLVETSLGTGIVCDTGGFIYNNQFQLDIATAW